MRLIAKSGLNAPTLLEHTRHVLQAVEALFGMKGAETQLCKQWLRFFRVVDSSDFLSALSAAAWFHDIGKANDGFQNAVNAERSPERPYGQLLRHEHLSGLILCLPAVVSWTGQRSDIDWDIVLAAVISHHCKAATPGQTNAWFQFGRLNQGQSPGHIRFYSDVPAFHELLAEIGKGLALDGTVPELPREWSFRDQSPPGAIDLRPRSSRYLSEVESRLDKFADKTTTSSYRKIDQSRRRLLWSVRAALIVADAAGSGLVREGHTVPGWIHSMLSSQLVCTKNEIQDEIIQPRIEELIAARKWDVSKGNGGWSEFQERCDALPSRSLLIAPCGSGKTLAAWRWIAAQCDHAAADARPVQRAIFLYPTRATATEGFRDYVSWAPEAAAALMHGTAAFDLDGLFENPSDDRSGKHYETSERLFAMGFWPKRYFAATVDQFLGFMQYSYSSLVMLPVLAQSVVVVDEVHSFDTGLFSALKDFLKHFDIPVLCMTASLTENRKQQLIQDCDLKLCDDKSGDLQVIADAPRYSIHQLNPNEVVDEVRRQLRLKRKVLWVVNQVRRAQQAVCDVVFGSEGHASPVELAARFHGSEIVAEIDGIDVPVLCYHSRFRLCDRRSRHSDVVRRFQGKDYSQEPQALLAVTTQVCEMSLDLDADVVITEMAPTTALIQRMGRCNRVRAPRDDSGVVFVYRPDNDLPYDKKQIDDASVFVARLQQSDRFSQSDLEALLAEFPGELEFPKSCQFLESGPFALSTAESLRDGEEFTTPAILPEDVDEVIAAYQKREPIDGWVTPVSIRWRNADSVNPRLPKHLIVAPPDHYHSAIGFCDRPIYSDNDRGSQK